MRIKFILTMPYAYRWDILLAQVRDISMPWSDKGDKND